MDHNASRAASHRRHSLHGITARILAGFAVALSLGAGLCGECSANGRAPNIIVILADDLGWGDVGAYGAQRIATPNIDRLASEGLRFTSGYAAAATCTPSRYALLTGEYAWRRKGTGIAPGDAAMIIAPGRTTAASILQRAGYRTGVVGKWHLGLGDGTIDWNGTIAPGPAAIGFEESFIMPATNDRVPCVYVRDGRVVGLDPADPIAVNYRQPFPGEITAREHPELLRMRASHGHDMALINGVGRIGYMQGGKAALWKDEEMADTFAAEAVRFIERHRQERFFLYYALHQPHCPRLPHPRFAGKTGLGPRGDVIVEADWCVGEVLAALDRLALADDTLVIFTSDNGPVLDDGYQDDAVRLLGDHTPAGPFRGGKYSKFEGGTRLPWIVRWPARVRPGVSEAVVSQVDLPASLAALVGQTLGPGDAPDSQNVLPALLGDSPAGRECVVEQGIGGLGLRVGSWKYIEPSPGPAVNKSTNTEMGNASAPQLYHLADDPGERVNLAARQPDRLRAMQERLEAIRRGEAM